MPDVMSWVAPDGTELLFDGSAYTVLLGPQGRFMPPLTIRDRAVPLQPGARFDSIQVLPRDVDLPLLVRGTDGEQVRTRILSLVSAMDPAAGDGTLRVIRDDSSTRELRCRYSSGLEGDESQGLAHLWQKFLVVLHASDPYWYGASQSITMTVHAASTFFPLLPLTLTSSEVFDAETVTNAGDVPTWPVWRIIGPGSQFTLRNVSTGEQLVFNASIVAGEQIIVDTRPGAKLVRRGDGENLFSSVSPDSILWALAPGDNRIVVQMSGSTDVSSIQLTYDERYRSA